MSNKHLLTAGLLGLFSVASQAQDLTITLTNLTPGISFTPIIAAAHNSESSIFHAGTAATTELQALAEGGSTDGVNEILTQFGADIITNPALGLLGAGESTEFPLTNTDGNDYLSIAAMMLPTNDGFIGLDSWNIPTEAGTYTVLLNAYDAGTEVNDEIIGNIPNPLGITSDGATGVATEIGNANVHVHPGVVGDTDPEGGISDLDSTVHRWLNPVAKLTIVVE
ncbi:spondin domain-containing protein [Psychromonas sp.]|nr:spondin domain-containing protein [Psychromonas sp.]